MHRYRTLLKTALIAAVMTVTVVTAAPAPVGADVPPPAQVKSNYETERDQHIVRDCGYSEPVPGSSTESVWVFCDSIVRGSPFFIPGSTAARGPRTAGMVPTGLSELPTPPAPVPPLPNTNPPARFLPQPTGLFKGDGSPCAGGGVDPASWTTGMTRIPGTSRLLLTYIDVCVQGELDYVVARLGTIEYTPSTNRLSNQTTLFSAPSPGQQIPEPLQLGSPRFFARHLYLFASECDSVYFGVCVGGDVFLARVLRSARDDASAYRFRRGSSWVTDPTQATNIVPGATPTEVSVDHFGAVDRALVMVEGTSIGGHYRVWEATSPTGPWTQTGDPRTVDLCTPPPGRLEFCRALIAQPELSTTSDLAVTHYSVEEEHIRMTTSPW
jgi:hypothetical protein